MITDVPAGFRSGFVAIAGRPNTGKSTFLNVALGHKVAIVTHKPQTTRTRILGVLHQPTCQMVFLDTPGIHDPGRSRLGRAMVRTAKDACRDVDLLLYFVDLPGGFLGDDWGIFSSLPKGNAPVFLVLNKVDRVPRAELLPILERLRAHKDAFAQIMPISALTGENVERLVTLVGESMKEGPPYFPEGQISDQPETFITAEMIREKLFTQLRQELPYALAVRVESFVEREECPGLWDVEAVILVERESHKGMVIGKGGQLLKRVGTLARQELEGLLGLRMNLKLWVRVKKEWRENISVLRSLGYPDQMEDGV